MRAIVNTGPNTTSSILLIMSGPSDPRHHVHEAPKPCTPNAHHCASKHVNASRPTTNDAMELPSTLALLAPAGGGVSFGAEVLVSGDIPW